LLMSSFSLLIDDVWILMINYVYVSFVIMYVRRWVFVCHVHQLFLLDVEHEINMVSVHEDVYRLHEQIK
jgi:hypothetical protein